MNADGCEGSSSRRRGERPLRLLVAALAALVVGHGRAPDAAADYVSYQEPFAYTEAIAPYSGTLPVRDLDATLVPGAPTIPPVAKSAYSISSDASNLAFAQALANADGARGFSAAAFGIHSSWSTGHPRGDATAAMAFTAQTPLGEGRVKAILEFSAALTASPQLGGSARSYAGFWIEGGQWALNGIADYDGTSFDLRFPPDMAVPAVIGAAGFHQQLPDQNASRVTIYANGVPIESKPGNGPVVVRKRIVMKLPQGALQVIYIGVTAIGNAAAYLDPVILPHPDNPDAIITLYGGHDPTSPVIVFPSAQLAAAGIDLGPLEELGVLDEPEPPCTGGAAIAGAKLDVREVANASSKLRFRGTLVLAPMPLDPPFDPIARGARVRIEDSAGDAIIDDTVPGGAFDPATSIGWRHEPGSRRWVYTHPGWHGIRRLVLKLGAAGEEVRFGATAYLPSSPVPDAERLPLTGTLVVDAPVARDDQCGEVTFGDEPTNVQCPVQDGSRLVCR